MKITQLKGFTPAEIAAYKAQVHGNILTNIRLLIKGAEQLGIQLDDPVRILLSRLILLTHTSVGHCRQACPP